MSFSVAPYFHFSFSLSVLQGLASWSQAGLSSTEVELSVSVYSQGSSSLKSPACSALSFVPPLCPVASEGLA